MAFWSIFGFDKYWWLYVIGVFIVIMFVGRRVEKVINWLTDREMERRKKNYGKKYEDDIFDYEKYEAELLGTDAGLFELIERIEYINKTVLENRPLKVNYLELWILSNIYAHHIVKSDENIYYINKKDHKYQLDLDHRDVNRWVLKLINDKSIKDRRVEVGFILHKIRTNKISGKEDPFVQNSIALEIFKRDYTFISKEGAKKINHALVEDEHAHLPGMIELNDGATVCFDKGVPVIHKEEKVLPAKEDNKIADIVAKSEDVEIRGDGSVRCTKESGSEIVIPSNLSNLKNIEKVEEVIEEEDEIKVVLPEVPESVFAANIKKEFEGGEDAFSEKNISADDFINKPIQKPKKKKQENVEKTQDQNNTPSESKNDQKEKKAVPEVSIKKRELGFDEFIQLLENKENFLEQYFLEGSNEIYFDEVSEKYYLSITHILSFISRYYINKDVFIGELFSGTKFDVDKVKTILSTIADSINEHPSLKQDGFGFGEYSRMEFFRAKDGYKEIYTYVEISSTGYIELISDKVVKGKLSKRYGKARIKCFMEQFSSLKIT